MKHYNFVLAVLLVGIIGFGYAPFVDAHTNSIDLVVSKTGVDVILNWSCTACPTPVTRVYRATLSDMSDRVLLRTTLTPSFTDFGAASTTENYYYQIEFVTE